jgi:HAD superfamily hydrolase (TIGR01509 family)
LHGLTWKRIEELLVDAYPSLQEEPVAKQLQELFHKMFVEDFPPLIPGAKAAFVAASQAFPTAIATSSNRETVEHLLDHLALNRHCRLAVCAEDFSRSKPDPECFLLAAERLDCDPGRCLVFEDSFAGVQAAKGAGMPVIAISANKRDESLRVVRALADASVEDFTELAPDFFASIGTDPDR